ncbi:hypothetical protein BJF86_13735 [Serinicoccus sp. CNJ-927]|uniref:hypothetical protein n=1 Tax=Serinicoccus sp. CNJ-927 TaxID=1904970 RepID=UPI00095C290F|nr:hypothetical protein [Serinicoccus sp. CNJ-927]OLT43683.1 hypothetical protein BJF86_13735 [Serinicoccus sp. CNJ-927]
MSTTTLPTLTIAAGAGLALALATPAVAVDEDDLEGYADVSCDVMAMPGTATATYIDEAVHGPYLDGDNEWVALTLTSDEGEVAVEDPEYGETYGSEGGAIIREITLCQGTAAEAADAEEAPAEDEAGDDAGDDADAADGSDDDSATSEDEADDETAGPAVETAGPLQETGMSPLLVGGAVLALVGAGAAAVGVRRRGSQQG